MLATPPRSPRSLLVWLVGIVAGSCTLPGYETGLGPRPDASGTAGAAGAAVSPPTGGHGGAASGGVSGADSGGSGGVTSGGSGGATTGGVGGPTTGGETATGGSAAGAAGVGTGGAPGGTGGASGGAGQCARATTPAPAVISDFESGNASVLPLEGRGGSWLIVPGANATLEVVGGALQAATTGGSWAALSTAIATGACYDASAYTGVSFRIFSPANTLLSFFVVTPETSADFSHFRATFAVTSSWETVYVPFANLAPPAWGAGAMLPPTYDPSSRMTSIGMAVLFETELLDITIDDIAFY